MLASHFVQKHCLPDQRTPAISSQALAAMMAYDWPGNIRELENAIIRGAYFCRNGTIEAADLGLRLTEERPPATIGPIQNELPLFKARKQEIIEAFERDYLTLLMQKHQGNVTQAARAAGKERRWSATAVSWSKISSTRSRRNSTACRTRCA